MVKQYIMQQAVANLKKTIFHPPTPTSGLIYLMYYAYICVGSILMPGRIVNGHPHPKRGPSLQYKVNGFRLLLLTMILIAVFGGLFPLFQFCALFKLQRMVDEFWALWSTVNAFSLLVSILMYLKGKMGICLMGQWVDYHSHGSFITDFWIGRQINPRIGSFDIKFNAYRTAMIFWLVLNLSFMAKQQSELGTITLRMVCYQLVTSVYMLDYLWNEQKVLTTWDIISEEFGHMLVFGTYVFIPFVFSIQLHYILHCHDFQGDSAILILLIFLVGYGIFRTANSQKHQFKTQRHLKIWGKQPQTIGGKILISGFWGIGRHMNYTGDLIMGVSYCLPCGTQLGGYTYLLQLVLVLTHRAYRDDAKCKAKYGKLWEEYCTRIPYVYGPIPPIDSPLRFLGKILYKLTDQDKHKTN